MKYFIALIAAVALARPVGAQVSVTCPASPCDIHMTVAPVVVPPTTPPVTPPVTPPTPPVVVPPAPPASQPGITGTAPNGNVATVDGEETAGENGRGINAVDGNPATTWHTPWSASSPPPPHQITLDLGSVQGVTGLSYLPRQDGGQNGRIKDYAVFTSVDGTWGAPVATGTWPNDIALKVVSFAAVQARYVRLLELSEVNGRLWASAAEVKALIAAPPAPPTPPAPPSPPLPVPPDPAAPPQVDPAAPPTAGLITPNNLVFRGSFRVPHDQQGPNEWDSFQYASPKLSMGTTPATLFATGHPYANHVAEINIPADVVGRPVATLKQRFGQFGDSMLSAIQGGIDSGAVAGGVLAYKNYLVGSAYVGYDANGGAQTSHWVKRSQNLTDAAVAGPYKVDGVLPGGAAGAMALIDSSYRAKLGGLPAVTGQMGLNIITRTCFGPCIIAFDPDKLGTANPSPAVPLVYYPSDHYLAPYGNPGPPWNGSVQYEDGIAWIGRSVLVFGRMGLTYCYGFGTLNPADDGTANPDHCYDPTDGNKGVHGYPYRPWVWVFDAEDLVKVYNGQLQPWDVRPASMFELPSPFTTPTGANYIKGATYDPFNSLLYVSLGGPDDPYPDIAQYLVK